MGEAEEVTEEGKMENNFADDVIINQSPIIGYIVGIALGFENLLTTNVSNFNNTMGQEFTGVGDFESDNVTDKIFRLRNS